MRIGKTKMNSGFNDFEEDLEELNRQLDDISDDTFVDHSELTDDEIIELELAGVNVRTAILAKDEMIALICLKTAEKGGAICRVDPRENNPAVQIYDDADKALDWFTKSLRSSKKNGWRVVYDGLPLEG